MTRAITTFLYVGLIPVAPGTWGALAALPCAWALHWAGGFPLLALATLIAALAGHRASAAEIAGAEHADPAEIVIDEVVGQWIALWPLSFLLWKAGSPPHVFPWPGWLGAFLLFRLFDIWKPWPVSWADGLHGATGIMLDDVIAGLIAAALVTLAAGIAHGWWT